MTMTLVLTSPGRPDVRMTVEATEREEQEFGDALYNDRTLPGEFTLSLEDEAGARLGVRGVRYDSEE